MDTTTHNGLIAGASALANSEENMEKIRILRGTVCGGKVVRSGQVVNASARDARVLINAGKAEVYVEPKRPARRSPVNRQVQTSELEAR